MAIRVMLKNLVKQLRTIDDEWWDKNVSSPIVIDKSQMKKKILRGLSKHVLNLYEKKSDIRKFTMLALSNKEDESHNNIVDELFRSGTVIDPLSPEKLNNLVGNDNFLKDLGFEEY
ncbi:hypothetical protein J6G99_05340 [bacterium]|nr:hypothetical protein [bacterium]